MLIPLPLALKGGFIPRRASIDLLDVGPGQRWSTSLASSILALIPFRRPVALAKLSRIQQKL
jgi:hypothetical protein